MRARRVFCCVLFLHNRVDIGLWRYDEQMNEEASSRGVQTRIHVCVPLPIPRSLWCLADSLRTAAPIVRGGW